MKISCLELQDAMLTGIWNQDFYSLHDFLKVHNFMEGPVLVRHDAKLYASAALASTMHLGMHTFLAPECRKLRSYLQADLALVT